MNFGREKKIKGDLIYHFKTLTYIKSAEREEEEPEEKKIRKDAKEEVRTWKNWMGARDW